MSCEKKVVSKGRMGCIQYCGCGMVTIHWGNASVRIRHDEFIGYSRMVDEAFTNLVATELGIKRSGPNHDPVE